jgi:hypothetical protein
VLIRSSLSRFLKIGSVQFFSQLLNFSTLFFLGNIINNDIFSAFFYIRLGLIISIEFARFSFEKSIILKGELLITVFHFLLTLVLTAFYYVKIGGWSSLYIFFSFHVSLYYLKEKVYYNYSKNISNYNKLDLIFNCTFTILLAMFYVICENITLNNLLFLDALRVFFSFLYSLKLGNNMRIKLTHKRSDLLDIVQYSVNYLRNNPILVLNAFSANLQFKTIIILLNSLADLFRNRVIPIFQILLFENYKNGSQIEKITRIIALSVCFQMILYFVPIQLKSLVINDFVQYQDYFLPILVNSTSLAIVNLVGVDLRFTSKNSSEIFYSAVITLSNLMLFSFTGFNLLYIKWSIVINLLIPIITIYVIPKVKRQNS